MDRAILTHKPDHVSLCLLLGLLFSPMAGSAPVNYEPLAVSQQDPHYTGTDFFDIHVCNWHDRPLFLLGLFSTTRFDEVTQIELFAPDGTTLGQLNLDKYRAWETRDKKEKRAFIKQFDIPAMASNGWYSATATLRSGKHAHLRDYVITETLQRATQLNPPHGAEGIPLPKKLTWAPVPGARHYQIFIKDMWNGGDVSYSSDLLDKPELIVPAGVLEPGGSYRWRVHARDVNIHVLLGDFNHGSLTGEFAFTIADE